MAPKREDPMEPDSEPILVELGGDPDPRSPRSVVTLIVLTMVLAAVLTIAGFYLVRPAGWQP